MASRFGWSPLWCHDDSCVNVPCGGRFSVTILERGQHVWLAWALSRQYWLGFGLGMKAGDFGFLTPHGKGSHEARG